jgi:hypothetical protein
MGPSMQDVSVMGVVVKSSVKQFGLKGSALVVTLEVRRMMGSGCMITLREAGPFHL